MGALYAPLPMKLNFAHSQNLRGQLIFGPSVKLFLARNGHSQMNRFINPEQVVINFRRSPDCGLGLDHAKDNLIIL